MMWYISFQITVRFPHDSGHIVFTMMDLTFIYNVK